MKRKRLYKIVFFTFALLIFSLAANAQYNSEEDMKKAANQLFNEENYIEALPLFSQLLSTYPKDVNYNYKYGASALFAKNDKEKPLRYLKFAASKANVDPLAYYFLAKAQHLNYNFDAAILYYNKFKEKGNSRDIQRFEVSRQIEMCENGKKLLKSVVDIGVIDKKEIKETEFFRSYHLKGIDGKVTVKPDDFMSKLDKKKKENSLIYIGGTKDKIIFSSYGKTENSGRDLFSIERVPGGGWTEPTTLGLSINTKYDENYPFLHPDGKTLYFCSKGYNSMGGYDIFKSVYNSATGTWSKPENLDFPINTPGDDVMYISDEDNKLAYFASSRASKQGKMIVYHVTVDSKPDNKSVIKGMFLAEENPSMKSATITIRDVEKDRRYAVYTTHEVTGEYMLVFPTNGGKFKILVETTNEAPVHSAIIEIPPQDDFRALKQELILVGSGDDEKLVVKNLFDESDEFSIADPLYVEHVLKKKANLDVNTTEEEVFDNSLQASLLAAQTEEEATSVYANLSDKELLNQSNTKANELKAQTTKSKEQANFAYQEANTKSAEAKKIFAEAQNEPNETVATTKKQAAADLINETVALLAVARSLESEANERESDVANINKLQKEINTAIDAGNRAEAEEKATKLDEIASATYQQESILDTELALKEEALATKEKAYHKDRANVIESTNRKFEIEKNINDLEAKKSLTKKKKEIEDYTTQLEALKIDLEDAEFDLDKAKAEEQKSKEEYIVAKNELITTKKVKSNVASSNNIVAELDDANKLRIEGDIAYLDKEGVVGNYAKNTTTETNVIEENNNNTPVASTYNVADEKEVYNIVNNEGKLIDYNTNYKKELEAIAVVQNEKEKQAMTIQVNEDWIAAIDEEIEIREKQKASITSNEEKNELDGMITELKARKLEKREAIAGMNIVAETNVTNNSEENNTTATNTSLENTNESNLNYEESFAAELEQFSGDENIMAITENNTNNERTSDPVINTSNNSSYPINTDVAVSPSNNTNNSTESANANTVAKNEAYEPLSISLPSTDVTARANRLVKEAEVLNAEAKILTDSAATIKKKKEKTPLLVKAEEMKAESQRKIKEAEVLYAEAETMKVKEVDVAQQLSTNRTAIASEKLTNTEKEEVTNLSAATVNAVINSNNYQDYAEAKKETRRLIKSAEVEYIKADEVQQEADEQKTLGLSLNAMMAGAQTSTEKEKLAGQIDKLNAMIAENEEEAATLRKSATKKEQEALLQKEKTDLILINASEEDAKNIVAIEKVAVFDAALFTKINNKTDELANNQRTINENRNVDENATETTNESGTVIEENNNTEIANNQTEEVNETVTVSNIDDNITVEQPTDIDVVPAVLRQSIFKIGGNQASYSNSNPIPSVSTLPKGVVFKVQIGAFRNPIPQNHFKGFAPIVKEDAGNGITRYTAGLFKGINMAVEAKNAIRSIGYSDAFVVAFYNGKRISIAEARAKLGEEANETLVNNTSNNASSNNNSQNTTTNNSPNNTTIVETEEVNDGVSTDVRNITGAFFTIQVGVYSKPVSANQLRNVTPLNSERTASGLIRYTSGVYKTLYEANAAKDRIRSLGISDAFVVAYNGGQKITVAQANNMLSSTETPTTKETPTAVEPIEENVVEDEDTPVIVPTIEDIETPIIEDKLPQETTSDATNALIEYKVQLGAYEEEVPVEDAGIFLRLTGRGVKNFEEDGKTIYTIGSFPDYNSALDLQIEMKELGVKKPKVLAFKNGNMITVEEALEIQKNN